MADAADSTPTNPTTGSTQRQPSSMLYPTTDRLEKNEAERPPRKEEIALFTPKPINVTSKNSNPQPTKASKEANSEAAPLANSTEYHKDSTRISEGYAPPPPKKPPSCPPPPRATTTPNNQPKKSNNQQPKEEEPSTSISSAHNPEENQAPPPIRPGDPAAAAGSESDDPVDRKSTRLNSSHSERSRMPSSA